ncbi:MAG: diacylglycerol kinase family protein [Planctomycetota bacterium]|nr:diacylglycerol kinase family protein [Planctomycetota bacterium]MDA1105546.1 diacylglycerol kinase family protein [Planctomycetota bacterium]
MRVLLLCNSISGGGQAMKARGAFVSALRAAGHSVAELDTQPGDTGNAALEAALRHQEVLVVMGGDGTIRGASIACVRAGVPVYALPFGTENLFARHYRFTRRVDHLLASLHSPQVSEMDVGEANGERFLIMASIGFDAEVVADLAARRKGRVSKFSYAAPILRTALRWRGQSLTVTCDQRAPQALARGTLVIANLREYAARLDPVPSAVATDGRLDAMLVPGRTAIGTALGALMCWLRTPAFRASAQRLSGEQIRITAAAPFRFQVDGDCPHGAGSVTRLDLRVVPGRLRVLLPV